MNRYKKCDEVILVTRANAIPLKEGEYFLCDVIGCGVEDEEGNPVGTVAGTIETAANNVFAGRVSVRPP